MARHPQRFARTSAALVPLALVLMAHCAQGAQLGRLFFSATERAKLEAIRNAPKPVVPAAQPTTPAPIVPDTKNKSQSAMVAAPRMEKKKAPQRTQVMTGFVERSSGSNTVWINNQAQKLEGGYGELDALDVGKARRK